MQISKAIVTAASRRQRTLPLQTLIDSDGIEKTVLCIIIEEALGAGIQDIAVVVCPGDERAYAQAAGDYARQVVFVEQTEPLGYGHAIYSAAEFAGQDPFLHLVGDHLYVSESRQRCAQSLVQVAETQSCSVSAVQPSRESLLPYYGCIGGKLVAGHPGIYEVDKVLEKPTPTEAENALLVPGLRAGHYLCFFGMHVLTHAVLEILGSELERVEDKRQISLSSALDILAGRERHLAFHNPGRRYDMGVPYGSLKAQVALALAGRDRDEVLASLLELMIQRELLEGDRT